MITPGATDALSFRREADSGPSIGASGTTLAMGSHEQELNALLRHVAQGDKLAFKRVYDLIAAKLNGIALRLVRRRDIAEDVLQETFLSIWKNASQYDDAKGAAFTWCAMIVRNKALDRARRMSRRPVEISPDATVHSVYK